MHPPYPRTELQRRICEAVENGASLHQLEERPGFPTRQTVFRWAREDDGFAAQLTWSRAWGRGVRREAFRAPAFRYDQADAFLARVRAGEPVRVLVKAQGMPRRETLDLWKRIQPEFAAAFEAAKRAAPRPRRRAPRLGRYDEALADRIVVRLNHGEPMARVLSDPTLPSLPTVRRWRRARPDFDHALKMAILGGQRARMSGRRKITAEVAEAICQRIVAGASIAEVGRAADMPHAVTIHLWMRRNPEFARQVREACDWRDEMLCDMAGAIAEAATLETLHEARARYGQIRTQVGRMKRKGGRAW